MITYKRRDNQLRKRGLLVTGTHLVEIEQIAECCSVDYKKLPWKDKTVLLFIRFKNNEGIADLYLKTTDFATRDDFIHTPDGVEFRMHPEKKIWYAVNSETNERVVSPEKTKECQNKLFILAYCCGISISSVNDFNLLLGKKVLVKAQEYYGYPLITNFYLPKSSE